MRKLFKNIHLVILFISLLFSTFTKGQVVDFVKKSDRLTVKMKDGLLVLKPIDKNAIRVQYSLSNIDETASLIFTEKLATPAFTCSESKTELTLSTGKMSAIVNRQTGALRFLDAQGKIILSEEDGGRALVPSTVQGEPTMIARQKFISPADEYLFGTGQFQDGYMNIKGLTRRLTQVNTQISIPFIYSSKGYGLLWHNYGLTDFNPANTKVELSPVSSTGETITVEVTTTEGTKKEVRQQAGFGGTFKVEKAGRYAVLMDVGQKMARKHSVIVDNKEIISFANYWLPPTASAFVDLEAGEHTVLINGDKNDKPSFYIRLTTDETVFQSPVSDGIDYVVFAGKADDAIASYRRLSGAAPLMPIWALGYIHCRERFSSQKQILDNTNEFRNRKLPMDLIVQDWQYWGKYGWNAMQFDEKDYPDPAKLVDSLHTMNARLMVSVWSKVDPNCEVGKEMTAKKFYIPNTQWIDFMNPEAAACYWKNFSSRLLKPYKIDAWWQDATEPENDDLVGRKVINGTVPGEKLRNIYPLFVTKTVYEGSRRDVPEKRVCILTRSAFSGEQRYASATWSGDIGNDWETFRRQIPAGLNYVITGLPYWTTDCGGFFRPANQFTDTTYHERFLRWFQYATFCPLQRVHGYQTNTEFWRFGAKVEHEAMRYLNLRYRLLPYIYSQSAAVTFSGSTLMRPLVMDFADDNKALEQKYEYLFGPSMLVAPVVSPNVNVWNVYLPENKAGWYNFWNGEKVAGGQTVSAEATIDKIPLFVKAGSVIPLGSEKQYTTQHVNEATELRIYSGTDVSFRLYEDDGVSYNYEKGQSATIDINWNEANQTLTIGKRVGSFSGMKKEKTFQVVWVNAKNGVGIEPVSSAKNVTYNGNRITLKRK
jgi:alpha-D-xyloside xylohydrolase